MRALLLLAALLAVAVTAQEVGGHCSLPPGLPPPAAKGALAPAHPTDWLTDLTAALSDQARRRPRLCRAAARPTNPAEGQAGR